MKLSTQITLAFAIVILLSAIDSGTNYILSLRVQKNAIFLSKSEEIIRNSAIIHKAVLEMQGGLRGYLLTSDTNFLEPYNRGKRNIPVYLKSQKELIKENAVQYEIINDIERMHNNWKDYAGSIIAARKMQIKTGGSDKTYEDLFENQLRKQTGKKINDSISHRFLDFDRSEYKLRNERSAILMQSIRHTHIFSLIFISFTIMTGVISAIYIVNLISRRIKSMVRQAGNIAKGDFKIIEDHRNDELTGLSRSLNIMSEQLSQNIHELEKRNSELNKFAYVVSHDLKAPVRGIHNVIKWIEEDLAEEISPAMKKYLDIIPQRAMRMENLINGLLDYARINERQTPEEVDTNILVTEIIETIVPRHFKVDVNDLPRLYTERLKLEQVFSNIISNAVKYTTHSNGYISISCSQKEMQYYFSIKDNGIGIEPEYHQKIFEIFQTLREKNERESTGIGLAIVRKIIDDLQGEIQVISRPGQGAEFIFTWPVVKKIYHG
jgi:signal transduction histidine kinase